MLILADTSCWIEFFRPCGDEAVRAQLLRWLADGLLRFAAPVRAEVLRGARKAEAPKIVNAFAALPHLPSVDGRLAGRPNKKSGRLRTRAITCHCSMCSSRL